MYGSSAGQLADGESPTKKTKTPSKAKKVKEEPIDDGLGGTDGDEDAEGDGELMVVRQTRTWRPAKHSRLLMMVMDGGALDLELTVQY